ncbi:MAG: DNA/RNA non-specific endonuclease [Synergistaceae bacterium]|jgi:hypothetical protein|nr:DNA/RNA non-specific endonuclease [Synergistaceae bacterium]
MNVVIEEIAKSAIENTAPATAENKPGKFELPGTQDASDKAATTPGLFDAQEVKDMGDVQDASKDMKTEKPEEQVDVHNKDMTELSGIQYDDNGKPYSADGKLLPNTEYELKGYQYKTDNLGRIISAEGEVKLAPGERDPYAQRTAGGVDRRATDDGGHLIADRFGGDGGSGNLVPMDAKLNRGEFKKMENDIAAAKADGKEVSLKVEPQYSDNSARPTSFTVTYSIDGEVSKRVFSNSPEGK